MFTNRQTWMATACAMSIVLGGAALLFSLPGYRPSELLARRLESRIPYVADTELLPQVRRLTTLGEVGLVAVVNLLASERESEGEAAEIALSERLDQWRLLSADASAPKAIQLAKALASERQKPSPRSRRVTAWLATELLLWKVPNAEQAEELLAYCESILRRCGTESTPGSVEPQTHALRVVLESPPLISLPRQPISTPSESPDQDAAFR